MQYDESDDESRARQREKNRLQKRRYRACKSEEALARERERNRLYMRKVRATLSVDQEHEQADLEMCYMSQLEENSVCVNRVSSKRKPVSALTPEQLERQRERNRNYMRKVRAALYEEERKRNPLWKPRLGGMRKPAIGLTPEQLERQRERNRNYMRRFRASLSEGELQQRRERDRVLKRKAREMLKEQTLKIKHFLSYEQQWNLMRQFYMNRLQHCEVQNGDLEHLCADHVMCEMVEDNVQSAQNDSYVKEENVSSNVNSIENCDFT